MYMNVYVYVGRRIEMYNHSQLIKYNQLIKRNRECGKKIGLFANRHLYDAELSIPDTTFDNYEYTRIALFQNLE